MFLDLGSISQTAVNLFLTFFFVISSPMNKRTRHNVFTIVNIILVISFVFPYPTLLHAQEVFLLSETRVSDTVTTATPAGNESASAISGDLWIAHYEMLPKPRPLPRVRRTSRAGDTHLFLTLKQGPEGNSAPIFRGAVVFP